MRPVLRLAMLRFLVAIRGFSTNRISARMAALLSATIVLTALLFFSFTQSDLGGPLLLTPAEVVIPAGQEELLAGMLGKGVTLPGGCEFAGGQVDGGVVRATYTCAQGEVVLELRHPIGTTAATARTAQFAIVVRSGSPSPDFVEALASRIRSAEAGFEWAELSTYPPELEWQWLPYLPHLLLALRATAILLFSAAGLLGCAILIRTLYRYWPNRTKPSTQATTALAHPGVLTAAAIRVAGLIAVALITLRGTAVWPDLPNAEGASHPATFFGILALSAFLWLTLSGFFGYGSAERSDWVGLLPFLVALVVRQGFTLHSIQEIEVYFAQGPVDKHSVVYPLLQMFFLPIVRDPHAFMMQMNAVLGAAASLALYLFVRQRLQSRGAAFLCALFLATHPLVARFSPTDGPYSFLLATWFSGLALLSAPHLTPRSLLGGAVLLAIAATTRIEGAVLLLAPLLLLDLRALAEGVRRDRFAAALALLLVASLVAVQMHAALFHHGDNIPLLSRSTLDSLFRDAVWPAPYNNPLFMAFVWLGAVVGVLRRYRPALLAYLATFVLLLPVAQTGLWIIALHRMVPTCALQTIVAGIGAYSVAAWIPLRHRWRWLAVVPGSVAAFYILTQQSADLTRPYAFTEQYDLVRRHLTPGSVEATDCTLMAFTSLVRHDLDIHHFGQVVPGVRVLDCLQTDCLAELSAGGCFYYVRSAACYFHQDGLPPACRMDHTEPTGNSATCLNDTAATFEKSVDLEAIDVRTVDLRATFHHEQYPEKAEVGLFRVKTKSARPQGEANVPTRSEAELIDELRETILAHLDLQPGMVVAEIGVGRGWFLFRAAAAVGPNGTVYGTDIDPEAIALLRQRLPRIHPASGRVVLRLCQDERDTALDDLPDDHVDVILMVDSLCFDARQPREHDLAYLRRFLRILRPGGRFLHHMDCRCEVAPEAVVALFTEAGFSTAIERVKLPPQLLPPDPTWACLLGEARRRHEFIPVFRKPPSLHER